MIISKLKINRGLFRRRLLIVTKDKCKCQKLQRNQHLCQISRSLNQDNNLPNPTNRINQMTLEYRITHPLSSKTNHLVMTNNKIIMITNMRKKKMIMIINKNTIKMIILMSMMMTSTTTKMKMSSKINIIISKNNQDSSSNKSEDLRILHLSRILMVSRPLKSSTVKTTHPTTQIQQALTTMTMVRVSPSCKSEIFSSRINHSKFS